MQQCDDETIMEKMMSEVKDPDSRISKSGLFILTGKAILESTGQPSKSNEENEIKRETGHYVVLGQTRYGKGVLATRIAAQNGISIEELSNLHLPTEEEQAAYSKRFQQKIARDRARFEAAKEAYWIASLPELDDLDVFNYALKAYFGIAEPTIEQHKALFSYISEDVFGKGIAYGFDDSSVADRLDEFITDNKEQIQLLLNDVSIEK